MRFSFITAFPDMMRLVLDASIIGRAIRSGVIDADVVDIRSFSDNRFGHIDDYAYGSGGMILEAEPLAKAIESISCIGTLKPWVVYPSPQGRVFSQDMAEDLAGKEHVVFVCGHYEGIDERFVEGFVDEEISTGDYVVTGGELPSLIMTDAIARLIPGVVGKMGAVEEDSFYRGMLDHPHYTRPDIWRGMPVPEEIRTGNHNGVDAWRRAKSIERTLARRPDVLCRASILMYLKKKPYIMLVHHPVYDRNRNIVTTAVTHLDLHDIARSAKTYGIERFCVCTPLQSQREMARKLIGHWTEGFGKSYNSFRGEALEKVKLFPDIEKCLSWIGKKEGSKPFMVATSARKMKGAVHYLSLKYRILKEERPLVLVFGTGWGLSDELIEKCDLCLQPIKGGIGDYNHLSVRNAVTVILDRLFGWR